MSRLFDYEDAEDFIEEHEVEQLMQDEMFEELDEEQSDESE